MLTLFLTRKYPPSRGGMETFSYELLNRFSERHIDIVETEKNILISSISIFFRALRHLNAISVIHVGDAVLAPVGALLHIISKKPVVVTVHGLELTSNYGGELYHTLIRWSIRHITHWVAVSTYTADLAKKYGIKNVSVITHGVTLPDMSAGARSALEKKYSQLHGKKIVLSVGRLIRRKGLAWFLHTVLPSLPMDALLCIVSDGPERETLERIVSRLSLQSRVLFCGKVNQQELSQWYSCADVFVFPNIPTPYDVEGFGFTALEASAYGTRVFASQLQGIRDAVHHGHNGTLLPTLDAPEWITALSDALSTSPSIQSRAAQQDYVRAEWSWDTAVNAYRSLFNELV